MKPFHELALTKGYWLTKIQNELYSCVAEYLDKNKMTRTQFAEQLHVSKGYISQVLNGDFDHRLSKLIELSLAVGVVPNFKFQEKEEYIENYLSGYDLSIGADNIQVSFVFKENCLYKSENISDFEPHLIDTENTEYYSFSL